MASDPFRLPDDVVEADIAAMTGDFRAARKAIHIVLRRRAIKYYDDLASSGTDDGVVLGCTQCTTRRVQDMVFALRTNDRYAVNNTPCEGRDPDSKCSNCESANHPSYPCEPLPEIWEFREVGRLVSILLRLGQEMLDNPDGFTIDGKPVPLLQACPTEFRRGDRYVGPLHGLPLNSPDNLDIPRLLKEAQGRSNWCMVEYRNNSLTPEQLQHLIEIRHVLKAPGNPGPI